MGDDERKFEIGWIQLAGKLRKSSTRERWIQPIEFRMSSTKNTNFSPFLLQRVLLRVGKSKDHG